jgi:hypothetical protein
MFREGLSPSTRSLQQHQNLGRHDHLLEPLLLPDERMECDPVVVTPTAATRTRTIDRKSPVAQQESPKPSSDEQPTVASRGGQVSKSKARSSFGSQDSSHSRREREMKIRRSSRTIHVGDTEEDLTTTVPSSETPTRQRRRRGTSVGAAASARRTRSTTNSPSSSRRFLDRSNLMRGRNSAGAGARTHSRTRSPSSSLRRSERSSTTSSGSSRSVAHCDESAYRRGVDPPGVTDVLHQVSRRRRPPGSESSKRKDSRPWGLSASVRF